MALGAEKKPPRVAKAGEACVIFSPKNQEEYMYAWGLGHTFNNVFEVYGLYQGLSKIVNHEIQEVI